MPVRTNGSQNQQHQQHHQHSWCGPAVTPRPAMVVATPKARFQAVSPSPRPQQQQQRLVAALPPRHQMLQTQPAVRPVLTQNFRNNPGHPPQAPQALRLAPPMSGDMRGWHGAPYGGEEWGPPTPGTRTPVSSDPRMGQQQVAAYSTQGTPRTSARGCESSSNEAAVSADLQKLRHEVQALKAELRVAMDVLQDQQQSLTAQERQNSLLAETLEAERLAREEDVKNLTDALQCECDARANDIRELAKSLQAECTARASEVEQLAKLIQSDREAGQEAHDYSVALAKESEARMKFLARRIDECSAARVVASSSDASCSLQEGHQGEAAPKEQDDCEDEAAKEGESTDASSSWTPAP